MNYNNPVYYCGTCKKISNELDQLLFVEDNSTVGFCSEECIESYYMPLVNYYEALDKEYRKEFKLEHETCLEFVGVPEYMDELVSRPDEVWVLENELKQKLFSFIKEYKDDSGNEFSIGIICLVFNYQASFVIMATATQNKKYKDSLRIGKQLENPHDFLAKSQVAQQEINIDPETIELLENKKSQYLAQMMEQRLSSDIKFEEFHDYEHFFNKTINDPDEIYSNKDMDNDEILTYIKAHEKNQKSFFYFILFLVSKTKENEDSAQLIPIISFPSNDGEIYKHYKVGELLSGTIKN